MLAQDAVEPRAVGQPKAYPEQVVKALKAYQLPRPVERFVRPFARLTGTSANLVLVRTNSTVSRQDLLLSSVTRLFGWREHSTRRRRRPAGKRGTSLASLPLA